MVIDAVVQVFCLIGLLDLMAFSKIQGHYQNVLTVRFISNLVSAGTGSFPTCRPRNINLLKNNLSMYGLPLLTLSIHFTHKNH